MTDWDWVNRLELQIAQLEARLHAQEIQIGGLLLRVAKAETERDTARSIAVALENDLARQLAGIVNVPLIGSTRDE